VGVAQVGSAPVSITGDYRPILLSLRPGTPEVKVYKAVAFFQNLPWVPQPLPEIDDRTRLGAWYEMSYPVQYLLPFIAELQDAAATQSPPEM
jgi:hypothetical protein